MRRRGLGRWAARMPLTIVAILVTVGAFSLAAPAAQAATYECTPMSSDACKKLQPVAECVWDNADGTKTALWGWDNPTSDSAHIPVSNKNNMSPGADDQGQPSLFGPGRQRNVFTTTFTGTTASWHLGNNDAAVGTNTAACATKPVPQVGSVGALLAIGLMLGLGALTVASARRRTGVVSA
jgi:hypothetical protein